MDEYIQEYLRNGKIRRFLDGFRIPDYVQVFVGKSGFVNTLKYVPILKLVLSLPIVIPSVRKYDDKWLSDETPMMDEYAFVPMMYALYGSVPNIIHQFQKPKKYIDERYMIDWLLICGRNDALDEIRKLYRKAVPKQVNYEMSGRKIMRVAKKHNMNGVVSACILWSIIIYYDYDETRYKCYIDENYQVAYEFENEMVHGKSVPITQLENCIGRSAVPFIKPKIAEIPFAYKKIELK